MTFVILKGAEVSSKGGISENPWSYLDWKWAFLLQMSALSLACPPRRPLNISRSGVHGTALPHRAQALFLQLGLRQVRNNVDFQNRRCKLEASRANAALGHMLLNLHNILRIGPFLHTYQDFWLLRKIKPYWLYMVFILVCNQGAGLSLSVPFRRGGLSSVHGRSPTPDEPLPTPPPIYITCLFHEGIWIDDLLFQVLFIAHI